MALRAVGVGNEYKATVNIYVRDRKKWDHQYKTSTEFCFDELGQLTMTIRRPDSSVLICHILNEDSLLIKGDRDYEFKTHSDETSTDITHFRIRFKDHNQQSEFRNFIEVNTSTDSAPPSPSESMTFDEEEKAIQPNYNDRGNQIEAPYRCSISNNIMEDPVRVVGEDNSQVFERSVIESLIDDNFGVYIGPNTGKRIEADTVVLVACEELKQEITEYMQVKTETEKIDIDVEHATSITTTKPALTLPQIEGKIQELAHFGADDLAQSLKKQKQWIDDALTSDDMSDTIMNYAVDAVAVGTGLAVSTGLIASGSSVITATGAAVSSGMIAKLAIDGIKNQLKQQNEERKLTSDEHYERTLQILHSGEVDAVEFVKNEKKMNKIYIETQESLDTMQENIVKKVGEIISARLKFMAAGAVIGGVGGGMLVGMKLVPAAKAALLAAEAALVEGGSLLQGAELTAAALETLGGFEAFLVTHGTVATVGASLAGAACCAAIGYGIWWLAKYNGWWGE